MRVVGRREDAVGEPRERFLSQRLAEHEAGQLLRLQVAELHAPVSAETDHAVWEAMKEAIEEGNGVRCDGDLAGLFRRRQRATLLVRPRSILDVART